MAMEFENPFLHNGLTISASSKQISPTEWVAIFTVSKDDHELFHSDDLAIFQDESEAILDAVAAGKAFADEKFPPDLESENPSDPGLNSQ